MNNKLALVCLLCLALLGSNACLLYINHGLVAQHQADEASHLPSLNAPLEPIAVHGPKTEERSLLFPPDSHSKHLLLVMSPDCHYCEKNWPMWEALIKDAPSTVDVTFYDVTGKFDARVSEAHNIKDEQLITAPLASTVRAHIIGTPTTVLIGRDGNVQRVWQGVLDAGQLNEIVAMSKADAI